MEKLETVTKSNNSVHYEVGTEYSLSIGTDPLIKTVILSGIKTFYINVLTLFRNFNDCVDYTLKPKRDNLLLSFVDELKVIKKILDDNKVETTFYFNSYSAIYKYKWANLHALKTDKQVAYNDLEIRLKNYLTKLSAADKLDGFYLFFFKDKILPVFKQTLICTHIPYDLLQYGLFKELLLIDSYTGKIRGKNEWVKKLSANNKYHKLPFCLFTMMVIGDGSKLFSSVGKKTTTLLCDIAEKYNWTTLTTKEKIIYTLGKEKSNQSVDKDALNLLMNLATTGI